MLRRSTGTILLASLILVASIPTAAVESAESAMPFQLYGEADIIVPVMIDGRGPFQFLLDTGSSRSAISHETAQRLGRVPTARTLMVTPSGQAIRVVTPVERVTVGPGPPVDVIAMVVRASDLGGRKGLNGLIGQDVLARAIYTIDYKRRVIIWHPTPFEAHGTRLPLELSEGRLVVSLSQSASECGTLRFIPDSGADAVVLFARPDRVLPLLTPLDTAGLRTLSGQHVIRRVLLDRLDVGSLRLRDQMALLVDHAEQDLPLGDGLLPLHLFARVTFNGPDRYLIVEAR